MRVVTCEYRADPDSPTGRRATHRYDPTDEYVASLVAKHNEIRPPERRYVSWRRVPNGYARDDDDMTFREAWEDDGTSGRFRVNMGRAREIHRERLREMRAPLLEALDVEYVRADEAGDAELKADVARRKQALRDAPADPRIDRAKTPRALRAVVPTALKRE